MCKDRTFLFYDADAASDVSHLNRLERGCYFDIILAQKKFGRMTREQLRNVLGNDFDTCWKNLEMCLYCEDARYYIPWLEEAMAKRKAYCESRGRNRFGSKLKNKTPGDRSITYKQKGLFPENGSSPRYPAMKFTINDLKRYFAESPLKKEQIAMLYKLTPEKLERLIALFCLKENDYANRKDALGHFLYWLDQQHKVRNYSHKTLVEQWME